MIDSQPIKIKSDKPSAADQSRRREALAKTAMCGQGDAVGV
jgi:hypothetical protein